MTTITFDITKFREQYPEFSNEESYTDATLQSYFDISSCYISTENYGYLINSCRELALNLMTAHIAKIATNTNSGEDTNFINSATIDKISVSIQPPPQKDQYEWWLGLTSYGQQLLTLLAVKAVGGIYIGGSCERGAFRKAGGRF